MSGFDEVVTALGRAIVARHARMRPNGRPVLCTPSKVELDLAATTGRAAKHAGKIIYDTWDAVEAAAREFEALYGGRYATYQCERSNHGHQHIRTIRGRNAR